MSFYSSCFAIAWKWRVEEETFSFFKVSVRKTGVTYPADFQVVCTNDDPIVEELVQINIFLCGRDFVDGPMVRKHARRSVGRHSNAV